MLAQDWTKLHGMTTVFKDYGNTISFVKEKPLGIMKTGRTFQLVLNEPEPRLFMLVLCPHETLDFFCSYESSILYSCS